MIFFIPFIIYYIVIRQILIRTEQIDETLSSFFVTFQRKVMFLFFSHEDNKYSELLFKICRGLPYLN